MWPRPRRITDCISLFTDPVLLGEYPDLSILGVETPDVVRDGDLAVISRPIDGLGVNYYSPSRVAAAPDAAMLPFQLVEFDGVARTDFGWPVIPSGLTRTLTDLTDHYGAALPPLWVTENGCAYHVEPGTDGRIHDQSRIDYLDAHLRAVHAAVEHGADVRGYFSWSLLDNFEWAEGFSQHFGFVTVNPESRDREPKASFDWYRRLIAEQTS